MAPVWNYPPRRFIMQPASRVESFRGKSRSQRERSKGAAKKDVARTVCRPRPHQEGPLHLGPTSNRPHCIVSQQLSYTHLSLIVAHDSFYELSTTVFARVFRLLAQTLACLSASSMNHNNSFSSSKIPTFVYYETDFIPADSIASTKHQGTSPRILLDGA